MVDFPLGKITNHRLNKPRKMWRRWWFWVFLCERIGDLSEDWSKSWAGWFPWEFPWGFHVNYKQLNMIFECGKKWTTLVFTCRSTMEVWGTIFYFKTNISYFCWWYNYELVGLTSRCWLSHAHPSHQLCWWILGISSCCEGRRQQITSISDFEGQGVLYLIVWMRTPRISGGFLHQPF